MVLLQGGCCKICGGVTHLAKDCPDKGKKGSAAGKEGKTCKFVTVITQNFLFKKIWTSFSLLYGKLELITNKSCIQKIKFRA